MATSTGCKVDRTTAQYGLETADPRHESLDDGLLARWQGTDGHTETGYRTLTAWYNKRLLKRVYEDHERAVADTQLEGEYETLTGDDGLARAELIDRLEAAGIDGEGVCQDMVSWGTMRTHLTECLGGRKAPAEATTEWERNSIETARAVTERKVEEALSSLSTKGELESAAAEIEVQISVRCPDCPTRVPLSIALDRGYICDRHGTPDQPVSESPQP